MVVMEEGEKGVVNTNNKEEEKTSLRWKDYIPLILIIGLLTIGLLMYTIAPNFLNAEVSGMLFWLSIIMFLGFGIYAIIKGIFLRKSEEKRKVSECESNPILYSLDSYVLTA